MSCSAEMCGGGMKKKGGSSFGDLNLDLNRALHVMGNTALQSAGKNKGSNSKNNSNKSKKITKKSKNINGGNENVLLDVVKDFTFMNKNGGSLKKSEKNNSHNLKNMQNSQAQQDGGKNKKASKKPLNPYMQARILLIKEISSYGRQQNKPVPVRENVKIIKKLENDVRSNYKIDCRTEILKKALEHFKLNASKYV